MSAKKGETPIIIVPLLTQVRLLQKGLASRMGIIAHANRSTAHSKPCWTVATFDVLDEAKKNEAVGFCEGVLWISNPLIGADLEEVVYDLVG